MIGKENDKTDMTNTVLLTKCNNLLLFQLYLLFSSSFPQLTTGKLKLLIVHSV